MTRVLCFVLFGSFILYPVSRGVASELLSEAEYLAAFSSTHPASRALDERLGAMRGEVRRARALENPILGVERETPSDDREQVTWALTWTPPLDGRRGLQKSAAVAGVDAATLDREWSFAELRAELREAYASWALDTEREAVVSGQIERLQRIGNAAQERARAGEESGLAARRLSLAILEVEALAATIDAERIESRDVALGWMGRPELDATPVRPPLPESPSTIDPAEHASVAARRAEVRQAELESRLAGRFLRFPELTAGWQHVQEPEFDSSGLIVAGSWPLPLFDRQQGDRIAAESRLTVAKARLDIETHRVASRIAGAHAAYARLRDAAIGAMDSVAAADRITEAAAARFEAGESDATDLLETMRSVLSARMAAIDLYEEALATHRKLELLTTRSSSSVDGGER